MKKITLLTVAAMFLAGTADANPVCNEATPVGQSFLTNLFSKLSNSSTSSTSSTEAAGTIANVLGSLLGQSTTLSKSTIKGTWSYDGASCVLESDATLAQIGGTVVTSKIEDKIDTYLAKVGVKDGSCSFTFMENDSCIFSVGSRNIKGTYTLDAENKKIQFIFLQGRMTSTAYVSYSASTLNLVFNADRLLTLVKNVTPVASKYSTTLSTVSTLIENYKGMMLGMKLKK